MAPTRILSSDILIADIITPIAGNKRLKNLVEKYELVPGGKSALTKEQFDEFSAAIKGHPITIEPGGSSANTLTTLCKMFGKEIEVNFLGIIGDGMSSNMIRGSLNEAGINLFPKTLPPGEIPKTATSYVILFPDGQRTIATYPGNAKEILKPDMITDELVDKSDVLFVQGSLWQKLDWAFADKLLEQRWAKGKELWLALPTHAKFGEDKADHFKYLIPSANLVLGNDEELSRIYHTGKDTQKAFQMLQDDFRKNELEHQAHEGKWHGSQRQVGFITRGKEGAVIVTKDEIKYIPTAGIKPEEIVNTLGAGDTSFAGFAAGYMKGLPNETSAQIAMALAGEKLKVNSPRLPDPHASFHEVLPWLAAQVLPEKDTSQIESSTSPSFF